MLWQSGEILLIIDFLNLSIPYPDQTVSQSQRIGKIHRQDHHCNIFFQKPLHKFLSRFQFLVVYRKLTDNFKQKCATVLVKEKKMLAEILQ